MSDPAKTSPYQNFKRVATFVVRMLSLYKRSCDNVSFNYLPKSLSAVKKDVISAWNQDEVNQDNHFNVNYFRVRREIKFPSECKKTLVKFRVDRTEEELDRLMMSLRWIRAFPYYPKSMQRRLCRAANYARYGPGRTIVQQQHRANAVYWIMNGKVAVVTRDTDGMINLATMLRQGQEFGEECLVAQKPQHASVIAMSTVELLGISSHDFEDIFMAEGVKRIFGEEYDNFLGNMPFLKGWPLYKLSESPSSCIFHYFSNGEVIVKDSNASDWIYIVKSGSVSVMKKLTKVRPRRNANDEKKLKRAKNGIQVMIPFQHRRHLQRILPPLKLPEEPILEFQNHFELQMKMNETIPGLIKENDRLGILDYERILQEYRSRIRFTKPQFELQPELGKEVSNCNMQPLFPDIIETAKGVYMSAKTRETHSASKNVLDNGRTTRSTNDEGQPGFPSNVTHLPSIVTSQEEDCVEQKIPGTFIPVKKKPTFILVQVLEKGQYFGVGDIVFREVQPSFSLVSNGAECLQLSKSFFKQQASEAVLNRLRKMEVPYPSDADLQEKLQEHTDWEAYRSLTYRQFVKPIVANKRP